MNKIISLLLIFFSIFYSCVDSNLPKQSAFLRIEFPEPDYVVLKEIRSPLDFYYNSSASDINVIALFNPIENISSTFSILADLFSHFKYGPNLPVCKIISF